MNHYRSLCLTCRGWSMYPALRPGDGLEIAACAGPADLKRGDIVVYSHPEEGFDVAHRVVRTHGAGVYARGDNNDREDPGLVSWPEIKGKVVRVGRGSKSFRPLSGLRGSWIHYFRRTRNRIRRCFAPDLVRIIHPSFPTESKRGPGGRYADTSIKQRQKPADIPYAKPGIFPLSEVSIVGLACMNGNEASGNACVSGPEASGGCKSGAAASTDCRDGAAAGFNCKTGTGN